MDWLEAIFGICPDQGNGMTELTVVLGLALALAIGWSRRARRAAAFE
jgi:hypothetical protein